MSIDVVQMCPKHGKIKERICFGDVFFCPYCLADKLKEFGVMLASMVTIDRDKTYQGPSRQCQNCHSERPDTVEACPTCGHQTE